MWIFSPCVPDRFPLREPCGMIYTEVFVLAQGEVKTRPSLLTKASYAGARVGERLFRRRSGRLVRLAFIRFLFHEEGV